MQKLLKVAVYNHDPKHDPKDGMLESFARVRVYASLSRYKSTDRICSTLQLGARIHGTSISNSEQAVLKIPDNDTEDSSFEHLSEIKTAAHHTIQLFGGGIDIGTTIALPPRINIF